MRVHFCTKKINDKDNNEDKSFSLSLSLLLLSSLILFEYPRFESHLKWFLFPFFRNNIILISIK